MLLLVASLETRFLSDQILEVVRDLYANNSRKNTNAALTRGTIAGAFRILVANNLCLDQEGLDQPKEEPHPTQLEDLRKVEAKGDKSTPSHHHQLITYKKVQQCSAET